MDVTVEPATRAVVDVVTGFIAAHNDDDAQHIGYVGVDPDDIADTLNDLYDGAVIARGSVDGALVGVLGAEWDLTLGRTWLYGPWGDGGDALYAAVRPLVPAAAAEHELYCAVANTRVAEFAGRNGFAPSGESVVYALTKDRLAGVPVSSMPELTPDRLDEFAALHELVFPRSAYGAGALAERTPPPLVAAADGRLVGYVVLRLTPEVGTGELDYLAVAEPARGHGIGGALAAAAVHQAFRDERMHTLVLNTYADNVAAQRLYTRLGFRRDRPMRSFRTPRAGAAP